MKTIAILMAAGRGTRMNPLTNHTPKPLAKVNTIASTNAILQKFNGKTLLEINMSNLVCIIDEFVIVIHYLGQQIIDFIGSEFEGKPVQYVWAKGYATGTLDAFRAGIYESSIGEQANYIVSNSDNFCGQDYYLQLAKFVSHHRGQAALMATQIVDRELLKKVGVFVIDEQNNFIRVAEKSPVFVSDLANVGIYYFPSKVKELIAPKPVTMTNTLPVTHQDSQEEETITDLFNNYGGKYPIKILVSQDYNIEISTIQDLEID